MWFANSFIVLSSVKKYVEDLAIIKTGKITLVPRLMRDHIIYNIQFELGIRTE